jgi:fructoselysine 6-kinase
VTTQLLAIGDNVVDRYVDQGFMYPGGNAVNVAVHARRCGVASGYVGAVGTDLAGRTVLDALVQEGVDTTLTRVVEGPNAYAVVRVVEGNRVFGSGDVGVSRFRLSERDLGLAGRVPVVHTGECSMVEDQLPRLAAAAQRLSFDFSERPWDYVREHAVHADIAIRSCPGTTPDDAFDQARALQALGPRLVAVTLGADGAVVLDGERMAYAAPPAGPVVDTLGAGDAFIARLLVGLLADEPLQTLVTAATGYATSTCASFGAFGYRTPTHGTENDLTQHASPAQLDPIQYGGVDPS